MDSNNAAELEKGLHLKGDQTDSGVSFLFNGSQVLGWEVENAHLQKLYGVQQIEGPRRLFASVFRFEALPALFAIVFSTG